MNGKLIPSDQFHDVISLADWAPTHGRTEPWRFFVYTGKGLKKICSEHAELYKAHTPEENYNPATYDNLLHKGDKASHMIIAVMKRGANAKIPAIEEIASASASVENVLLGAAAAGISAMWNTGGMAHKQALKDHLHLASEDQVLGFVFFGYTDEEPREGKRAMSLTEKLIVGV
jgi:nitroreductase